MWTFVKPGNPLNTYVLRVTMTRGQNVSITVAKAARIAALEEADSKPDGAVKDFAVTAERRHLEATYAAGGYLRVTMEKWVSFDGSHAYASVRSPAAPSTRRGCATCWTGPSTRCGRSRQALRTSPIGPSAAVALDPVGLDVVEHLVGGGAVVAADLHPEQRVGGDLDHPLDDDPPPGQSE